MEEQKQENTNQPAQPANKTIERMVLLRKDSETIWMNLKSFKTKEDGTPFLKETNINTKVNEMLYNWALEEMEKPTPERIISEKESIELEERLLFGQNNTVFCPFCGSYDLVEEPLTFSKKVKKCKRLKKVRKRFKNIVLFSCNHCGKDFATKKKYLKEVKQK